MTRTCWRGMLKVGRESVEPWRNPLVHISTTGQTPPRPHPDPERGDGSFARNHRRAGDAHDPWITRPSGTHLTRRRRPRRNPEVPWFANPRHTVDCGVYSRVFLPYTATMQQLILEILEELSAFLAGFGQDLNRAALETIAAEAYREKKLSISQLRRLLGYKTRMQVHAFLKEHGVYLGYGLADLEHDRQAGDALSRHPAP